MKIVLAFSKISSERTSLVGHVTVGRFVWLGVISHSTSQGKKEGSEITKKNAEGEGLKTITFSHGSLIFIHVFISKVSFSTREPALVYKNRLRLRGAVALSLRISRRLARQKAS